MSDLVRVQVEMCGSRKLATIKTYPFIGNESLMALLHNRSRIDLPIESLLSCVGVTKRGLNLQAAELAEQVRYEANDHSFILDEKVVSMWVGKILGRR